MPPPFPPALTAGVDDRQRHQEFRTRTSDEAARHDGQNGHMYITARARARPIRWCSVDRLAALPLRRGVRAMRGRTRIPCSLG